MAITYHSMVVILLVTATGCLLLSAHVDTTKVMENPELFEGDIILTAEQFEEAYGKQQRTDVRIKNIVKYTIT